MDIATDSFSDFCSCLILRCDRGAGAVGKSALTIQLVQNQFLTGYDPTIENSYRKQIVIDEEAIVMEILDTAGQEEYSALRAQWIRSGQGFLLVYSIVDYGSFTQLESFRNNIFEARDLDPSNLDSHPPLCIVVNKVDREPERKVSKQEGMDLAARWNMEFFETSAKDRLNVDQPFVALVRASRRRSGGKATGPAGGSGGGKKKKSGGGGGGCLLL